MPWEGAEPNMKPTFLHQNKPLVTCMVQAPTVDETILLIRNAAYDGADAWGFQMENLSPEEQTEANLRRIFSNTDGKPIYATSYRGGRNAGRSDDDLAESWKLLIRSGATLVDIMGDAFCPTPGELTEDPAAVEKQMALIDEIHAMGGEVLMSSHVCRYIPAEEVLRIAKAHEARGADICKIVTAANSEEEEMENLRIITLLKQELGIPFLFLCGGSHCKRHRQLGPLFGCCMWLTVGKYDRSATPMQPLTRAMRTLADTLSYDR